MSKTINIDIVLSLLQKVKDKGITLAQAVFSYGGLNYHEVQTFIEQNRDIEDPVFNELVNDYFNQKKLSNSKIGNYSRSRKEKEDEKRLDIIRDSSTGKIARYEVSFVHREEEFNRTFSREEVENLYRLYTKDGSNTTMREINTFYFPDIPHDLFRKCVQVFALRKNDLPSPPHILEEQNVEENVTLLLNNKKKDIQLKASLEAPKFYKQELLKEVTKLSQLEQRILELSESIHEDFAVEPIKVQKKFVGINKYDLQIYVSDIHIGAEGSKKHDIYYKPWNEERSKQFITEGLEKIFRSVSDWENINTVRIVLLGDGIDGLDNKTTRGGHFLPQNLSSIDQGEAYIRVIMFLIQQVIKYGIAEKVEMYAVNDSNHGGGVEHFLNMVVQANVKLLYPDVKVVLSKHPLDHFQVNDKITYIYTHGKDSKYQIKPMPLNLNYQTESFINGYISSRKINSPIIRVIKGDSHRSSFNDSPHFSYRSCLPLFSGSAWQGMNFGISKYGMSFDIINKETDTILTSDIELSL